MKRNRKAEMVKLQHQLTRIENETHLLTEMEAVSSGVLTEQFQFTPELASEFTNRLRLAFLKRWARQPQTAISDKRLTAISQTFALAGMQVLKEVFRFSPERSDAWLKAMIERGNRQPEGKERENE